MTEMLVIGIAIAVLLYLSFYLGIVGRLNRIIELQTDQRDALARIADLLEVPYKG